MTGSKMRFSRSGHDPGIIRPWYPTEPPHALTAGESHKHAGWPRHAQRVVQFALSAGCHPPEWPPPYERPEHGHHARATRRVSWVVRQPGIIPLEVDETL